MPAVKITGYTKMTKLKEEKEEGKPRAKAARAKKEKAPEFVSCPGYVDEHGIWNNGFQCPKWGGVQDEYCCGSTQEPYCCPEPEPVTPQTESNYVPIIAGAAAGLAFIGVLIGVLILSCFFCPCCPGTKQRMRRTKKPKKASDSTTVHAQVCEHCHATLSSTSPDSLACGCPIGGPPGTHSHQVDEVQADVDRVLTLYENPAAHWHNGEMDEMNKEMPFDEPPPYSENAMGCKDDESGDVSLSPTSEDTPMILRLPGPNTLCMKTFRPLDHRALSPILRMGGGEAMMDSSRRDSGVLVEEQENNRQYMETEDGEEQDQYNESIMVPTFNFQSLNLVQKANGGGGSLASGALRGSTSSGGLSSSRTSGISHSRTRMRSRSSAESLELDQLMDTIHGGVGVGAGGQHPVMTGGHRSSYIAGGGMGSPHHHPGHLSGKPGHHLPGEQGNISGEHKQQVIGSEGHVTRGQQQQPYCTGKDTAHLQCNMRIPPV